MSQFIPKQYKKEPITIRMSFEKLKCVDSAATAFNLSRSEFINQCVDFALEHMPTPPHDEGIASSKRNHKT